MDWIPYMYTVAKIPKTGVVLVMNLFVAVAFLAFGELANLLLVSLSVCSILGGIVRKWVEYKNYK
jgi:energy-coupling factor transport system substrate-specific component